jgi:hypothetical protein
MPDAEIGLGLALASTSSGVFTHRKGTGCLFSVHAVKEAMNRILG